MSYKIDKDIPIPSGNRAKYPFKEMEVGDSFVEDITKRQLIQNNASTFGRRMGKKFKTRSEGDKVRIWRIA